MTDLMGVKGGQKERERDREKRRRRRGGTGRGGHQRERCVRNVKKKRANISGRGTE